MEDSLVLTESAFTSLIASEDHIGLIRGWRDVIFHTLFANKRHDLELPVLLPILNSHSSTNAHYGPFAYNPESIPPQKNQTEELNRTGMDRSASLRLPWGNTREVMPPPFLSRNPPKKLRRLEKKEDLADKLGLYVENSHECFRHAPLAFQARFSI